MLDRGYGKDVVGKIIGEMAAGVRGVGPGGSQAKNSVA
jgi:hypothetical protein